MEHAKLEVSVIMSVYNAELFLGEAIESILQQTHVDFEYIIVDDGSTDGSLAIMMRFAEQDNRIRIISRENKGLIYSLNEAIKKSTGTYIVRMDADDISEKDRIEKQLTHMKKHGLVLCGTWARSIDHQGVYVSDMTYPPVDGRLRTYSLFHNPFIHPSIMIRKDIIVHVGLYKNYKYIEDYELWTRIMYRYKVANLDEFLIKYRLHVGQVTKKHIWKMRYMGAFVRILAMFRYMQSILVSRT